ncbi:TonB-dependent receptor [Chitinophaga agrisoli]|uniref:TonB-dependent receptor n=1 Tax=Chitinophaga agrisoli TaxID=2607653 RepID=A0A5B2W1D7_9BACT|nr:TonB-dependent receptor [Chitinophaga agrisoli]KAA2245135.1 TonB-dependent receptor [Chitinophaga agrisoli]
MLFDRKVFTDRHKRTRRSLFLCALFFLACLHTYGQSASTIKVSVNASNAPLKEVLKKLEQQSGLTINYQDNVVDAAKPVSIAVKNQPLTAVLSQLLDPLGITYSQQGKMILVVKRQAPPKPAVVLTINGQVTDAVSGEPLIGVAVRVKGMDIGVNTDENGQFTIKLPQMPGALLQFSYIGYKRQELRLNNRTGLQIKLEKDTKGLDEVVVIGYGTVKKKDLTGAVGSVSMESMNKAPVASFDQALAGRVAGVMVSSQEGQPGSPINIIIRGNNSITQDNSPLYVIDGFPIEGPDNNILNPDDIESIDILKDASASAIYGARGANGVIIITTKRGKAGQQPLIRYTGSYGLQQNLKQIPVLSPYDFVKLEQEIKVSDLDQTYLANGTTPEDYKNAAAFNWQDKLFHTAPMQSHSLSMNGGNGQTRYAVSGQIFDQQGVIINSGFKRYQGKASLDQKVNDKLNVGINVLYTNTQTYGTQPSDLSQSSMNNLLYSAWGYRPVSPLNPTKEVGGDFEDDLYDDMVSTGTDYRLNPILLAENEYRKRTKNNLIANGYAEYAILKDLKLRVSGGLNKTVQRNDAFNNSKTRSGNPNTVNKVNGSIIYYETNNWLNENTLTYDKQLSKQHHLTVVAGMTLQGNKYSNYGMSANQLPNESLGLNGLSQGVAQPVISTNTEWSMASFLGRANYSFKDRYLFTVSYRADGSSKFRSSNQWSYFPSGAIAWRISNEAFMKRYSFISDAKARVSWGITGNNRVSEYATFAALSFPVSGYYSFGNTLQQSAVLSTLASEDLKWENTAQTDVGLDLGFFKQRLTFTMDYYKKVTSNLLLSADLPPSTGYGKAFKNVGKTSNEGFEFSMSATPVSTKVFSWTSSFNISFNRSKVLALTQNQETLLSVFNWDSFYKDPLYMAKIGQPLGQFYGYIADGVYQYNDFVKQGNGTWLLKDNVPANGTARNTIQPGDIKYRDLNGDGDVNADDRTVIGHGLPKHIGGFNNNISYRNFDLNIFFQWSYGNDIFNANRLNFESGNKVYLNQYASFANRWTPDHTNTDIPRAGGQQGYRYSTRVLEDGSYLRLKTVQLGYNLPSELLRRVKIKSCRFYISAQNLITWTKYTGADPEVAIGYSALTPGFDYSAYPRARTTTLGVNLAF